MLTDRRSFLAAAGALASGLTMQASAVERSSHQESGTGKQVRAIAFDAFPIIDATPVASRVQTMFPSKGDALLSAWRARELAISAATFTAVRIFEAA